MLLDWAVQGGLPTNLLYRASARRNPRARLFIEFVTQLLLQHDAEGKFSRNNPPASALHGTGAVTVVPPPPSGSRPRQGFRQAQRSQAIEAAIAAHITALHALTEIARFIRWPFCS